MMSDECYEGIGKEVMGRELGPSIKKCNCKSMGGGTPEKFSCVCEDYDGRKVEFPFWMRYHLMLIKIRRLCVLKLKKIKWLVSRH